MDFNRIKTFYNQEHPDLAAFYKYFQKPEDLKSIESFLSSRFQIFNSFENDSEIIFFTYYDLFRSEKNYSEKQDLILKSLKEKIHFSEQMKILQNNDFSIYENESVQNEIIDEMIFKDKSFDLLIGKSDCIKKTKREIFKVKDNNCKVLFLGESGTGKSLAARVLHNSGIYSKSKFISLNICSLQKDLIETTLFGSTRGAYTDARDRKGLIAMADGGMMFLDEIGELSIECQTKLLRVLDEGIYRRVGSDVEEKVNVRFSFATNANLKKLVSQKLFREDLYYRIAEFVIEVPPLRNRKEDILLIAESFLNEQFQKEQKQFIFSDSAKEKLLSHNWPGNIRELKTCINVATICATSEKINASDLRFN